ncbi:hypothetical protein Tco_0867796 [Tanacetum coccineum]
MVVRLCAGGELRVTVVDWWWLSWVEVVVEGGGGSKWWQQDGMEVGDDEVVMSSGIIMVNVIPPDHMDDVPVVEPNQHDGVPVVPEHDLEDENELELTYPYEEVNPLNHPPPASESEFEDVIEVEDTIESEDETIPASVHEVGESSTGPFLRKDSDGLMPGLMMRDINSLFGRMASLSRGLCGRERRMHWLKRKEKQRTSIMNERVERDLFWNRVRAHELYQEMIRRGFMFKKRPNEAIDVPTVFEERLRIDSIESASDCVEGEKSPSSELRGSPRDS